MSDKLEELLIKPIDTEKSRVVGRLITSSWSDENGLHYNRTFKFLKRKSGHYNFVYEDATMIGADQVWENIVNIDECADGIYEIITCNVTKDWESGCVDSYDYKLVPYQEPLTNPKK